MEHTFSLIDQANAFTSKSFEIDKRFTVTRPTKENKQYSIYNNNNHLLGQIPVNDSFTDEFDLGKLVADYHALKEATNLDTIKEFKSNSDDYTIIRKSNTILLIDRGSIYTVEDIRTGTPVTLVKSTNLLSLTYDFLMISAIQNQVTNLTRTVVTDLGKGVLLETWSENLMLSYEGTLMLAFPNVALHTGDYISTTDFVREHWDQLDERYKPICLIGDGLKLGTLNCKTSEEAEVIKEVAVVGRLPSYYIYTTVDKNVVSQQRLKNYEELAVKWKALVIYEQLMPFVEKEKENEHRDGADA